MQHGHFNAARAHLPTYDTGPKWDTAIAAQVMTLFRIDQAQNFSQPLLHLSNFVILQDVSSDLKRRCPVAGWGHSYEIRLTELFFRLILWYGAGLHSRAVLCAVTRPGLWCVKLRPTALVSAREAACHWGRFWCEVTQAVRWLLARLMLMLALLYFTFWKSAGCLCPLWSWVPNKGCTQCFAVASHSTFSFCLKPQSQWNEKYHFTVCSFIPKHQDSWSQPPDF